MDRSQMARYLPHGRRLDSGIHKAVPDGVDDVAKKLHDHRGPDPPAHCEWSFISTSQYPDAVKHRGRRRQMRWWTIASAESSQVLANFKLRVLVAWVCRGSTARACWRKHDRDSNTGSNRAAPSGGLGCADVPTSAKEKVSFGPIRAKAVRLVGTADVLGETDGGF